jgi:protein-S-isoprenylcysteine O-methyltransferase Ste14
MTTKPQRDDASSSAPDVPNLGLFRPPVIYAISLLAGVLINVAVPLPFLPATLAEPLGLPVLVVATALFLFSVMKFRAADTPLPARKPTTAIVTTGPYRFSRNPIYLAFSLYQLGTAILLNSSWLLATLAMAVALVNSVVIPAEEQYLERKFGAEYLDYKASVRRWL